MFFYLCWYSCSLQRRLQIHGQDACPHPHIRQDKNFVFFNDDFVSNRAPTLPRPIVQDDRT
jgi:hypothetical protein